jgi:hypothetical protein
VIIGGNYVVSFPISAETLLDFQTTFPSGKEPQQHQIRRSYGPASTHNNRRGNRFGCWAKTAISPITLLCLPPPSQRNYPRSGGSFVARFSGSTWSFPVSNRPPLPLRSIPAGHPMFPRLAVFQRIAQADVKCVRRTFPAAQLHLQESVRRERLNGCPPNRHRDFRFS